VIGASSSFLAETALATELQTVPPLKKPFPLTYSQSSPQFVAAQRLLHQWGDTSSSYMTMNPGNHFFFEASGSAFLAYRERWGVAISIGDPIGSPEARRHCSFEFIRFCQQQGLVPAFFALEKDLDFYSSQSSSPLLKSGKGMKKVQVAENAYLDLPNLQFKGKSWQDVRTALNRAKRDGIRLVEYDPQHTSSQVFAQLAEISREWLRCKKLPELGFTLGDLTTIRDKSVRTFYAIDTNGVVQGFVSWLPIYAGQGWTLDLMRRNQGSMQGIMEFLIASAALRFKEEGYLKLSLGACPLAPVQAARKLSLLEQVMARSVGGFNRFYPFQSLFAFKRKFQPTWQPLYLCYPSTKTLPRVSLTVLALYLSCPKNQSTSCEKYW
jgi:lysylphosphatidylglycerol synthetase-like protein (DUF2156 family)